MFDQLRYIKRYRMEGTLDQPFPGPRLPIGYSFRAWDDDLLETHAELQFESFRSHVDQQIFPSFGSLQGCQELLRTIRQRSGFCPQATWLISFESEPVGTIQCLTDGPRTGAVQNLGICPFHRRRGLGEALFRQALQGFRKVGMVQVYLEVTATNLAAIQLYRAHGFRCTRTIYKPILTNASAFVGLGI